MANEWIPVSGLPIKLAPNAFLKFYEQRTTTNMLTSDTSLGETTFEMYATNDDGNIINPSRAVVVPHVKRPYGMALYRTEADANLDATNVAIFYIPQCTPPGYTPDVEAGELDASDVKYLRDNAGVNSTVLDKLNQIGTVLDYGADKSGQTSSSIAFNTSKEKLKNVVVPEGRYLIGGIQVTDDMQCWDFQGDVTLIAESNGAILFHQSSNNCKHKGSFKVDVNARTGVIGMAIAPANQASTTVVDNVLHNQLPGIIGMAGLDNLIKVMTGPSVSGTLSRTEHNTVPLCIGNGATRVVWLADSANAGANVSRYNTFHSVGSDTGCNTGVHIEAGQSNFFYGLGLARCATGSSPNSTPTGVLIKNQSSATSKSNEGNMFFGAGFTGNTRDIQDLNGKNMFFGAPATNYDGAFTKGNTIIDFLAGKMKFFLLIMNHVTVVYKPYGWTIEFANYFGNAWGNAYKITHNLGTLNYIAIGSCTQQTGLIHNCNFTGKEENLIYGQIVENKSSSQDVTSAREWNGLFIQFA